MNTYTNPVLDADWPDPDVIRVGDDYYMVCSSFNRVPGLPVLHSRNLVDWTLISHALPRLVPEAHYSLPRHGGGVWAPAIRHHDGTFYIFYPDPDHGIFVVHADDPAGPWSAPHVLYAGRGIIDPCPFWDEDGRAYLAHAWAITRAGFWNRITMHEMAPDASRLVGPGRTVIDGEDIPGFRVLEGPKLYKRDGWYWIFAPAGTVPIGWQSVFRAKDIWGPYEERTVLAQGTTPVNGPHQGAWVNATDGSDWFIHFQDRGAVGRVVHLQPLTWDDEGWPRMGTAADDAEVAIGEPVLQHAAPPGASHGTLPVWTGSLPPGWHWQANPADEWLVDSGPGRFALSAVPGDTVNLRETPHVLAQRLPGVAFDAEVDLHLAGAVAGTRAGIVLLGTSYLWIGLRCRPGGVMALDAAVGGEARTERMLSSTVIDGAAVRLRVTVDASARARMSWRTDGSSWTELDEEGTLAPGKWIGTDLGLFAVSPFGTAPELPVAHFDRFSVSSPTGARLDTQAWTDR